MPIPTNMRPAGRSILGASRAIGTVAATVAATVGGEVAPALPGTPTIAMSIKSDLLTGLGMYFALPGTTGSYVTSSAWTALVVATPHVMGASDTVYTGIVSPIGASTVKWGMGFGATKGVVWQDDGSVKSVSLNAPGVEVKTGFLMQLASGTMTLEVSGGGSGSVGSVGDMASTAGSFYVGVAQEYFNGDLPLFAVWNSALSSGDLVLAREYAAYHENIVW